jgi:NDP-sugar pyrophosphorylase family protein
MLLLLKYYMSITKDRISITLDRDLVKTIDAVRKAIPRSSFIEEALSERFSETKTAVILAGGPAKNLRDGNTLKPLKLIDGKMLLAHQIDILKRHGFTKIYFIGKKEVIAEIFKFFGEKDLTYIEELKSLGSAHTLNLAREFIKNDFLFLPCDHYFEIDLTQFEQFHKSMNSVCTLAVYYGKSHEWHKSSLVEVEGNRIVRYDEKAHSDSQLTAIMTGFARATIFESIPSSSVKYSLQEDVFAPLAAEGKLSAYMFNSRWMNL